MISTLRGAAPVRARCPPALIAVPTLITGFMGMNVPFWGFQHGAGFAAAVIVIVVAVVLLYGAFKRSGWL